MAALALKLGTSLGWAHPGLGHGDMGTGMGPAGREPWPSCGLSGAGAGGPMADVWLWTWGRPQGLKWSAGGPGGAGQGQSGLVVPSGQVTPFFFSSNSGSSSHIILYCCTVFSFYLLFVWHGARWVEQNLEGHPRFLVPFLPKTNITSAAMPGILAQVRSLFVLSKP